jgi:hypothetical protein
MATRSSHAGTDAPSGRGRRIVLLWVAIIVTIAAGLLDFGFILNAIGVEHVHASRGGQIAGAIVFLAIVIGCSRWVVHIEHQLRAHTDVAKSYAFRSWNQPSVSPGPSTTARRRRPVGVTRRGRKYGPVAHTIIGLIYVVLVVGFTVGAISSHSQADRSAYTQSHEIAVTATVDSVDNTTSCGKSSCSYSAAVLVSLPHSIDGRVTSTIHIPRLSQLIDGESVAILVDPRQPGYSELPGVKFKSPGEWILLLILAVVFLFLGGAYGVGLIRMLGHRRAHAAGATGSSGSAPTSVRHGPKTVF